MGAVEAVGTKRKSDSSKRVAMDAQELQALLFKLFERQAHWKFSQLQQQTEQPTAHLKSVLSEIAVQLKSGPYKDLWELRREFKAYRVKHHSKGTLSLVVSSTGGSILRSAKLGHVLCVL